MKLGDKATVKRSYSRADLQAFEALAGQDGDGLEAVPGPLIGGLFSYLLGVELPGFGTNYLKQELQFLEPAPLDQELTATVEISRLRPEKNLVDLVTRCWRADGTLVCQGRALVLARAKSA
ncbi:hypothetical protein ACTL6U_00870 [Rhodovibrionaceae bacterium A322]